MSGKRKTKKILNNISREDAEQAFAEYSKADARIQQINATMDVQITKIREKYQDEIAELSQQKEDAFEQIQVYATENRQDFGNKKSLEMSHGIIGFRTGTPKLKTLKGFTWNSVTNLLKEFLPSYIRTTEEPAKDRLLSDREDPEIQSKLSKVGLFVDQDETFFVEPKKEGTEE